jgi:hypothetical protein
VEANKYKDCREDAARNFLNDIGKYPLHSPEIDDSGHEQDN